MSVKNDEDSESDSTSTAEIYWVNYFLAQQANNFLCRVEESYIVDTFNLYGLNQQFTFYEQALELICDTLEDKNENGYTEEELQLIRNEAVMLYGSIHARFITTIRGLQTMRIKYQNFSWGKCRHIYCDDTPLLPVGLWDQKNKDSVKLFCPSCENIYEPSDPIYRNIDGAFFGTTFPHLFLLTYPSFKPKVKVVNRYVPRIYGFRIASKGTRESLERKKKIAQGRLKQLKAS